MENFFIFLLVVIAIVAFIIALVGSIMKGLFELLCGLFAGAGIYGIITVVCIVIFIIAVVYIIKGWGGLLYVAICWRLIMWPCGLWRSIWETITVTVIWSSCRRWPQAVAANHFLRDKCFRWGQCRQRGFGEHSWRLSGAFHASRSRKGFGKRKSGEERGKNQTKETISKSIS